MPVVRADRVRQAPAGSPAAISRRSGERCGPARSARASPDRVRPDSGARRHARQRRRRSHPTEEQRMSAETSTWLNTQTLIGFTDQRGHAWHYRADDQGDEPNHYPGAVPIADVGRRLFGWDAGTAAVYAEYFDEDGFVRLTDETRKAVVAQPAPSDPRTPAQSSDCSRTGMRSTSSASGCSARSAPSWTTSCPSAPPASCAAARSPGSPSRSPRRSPHPKASSSGRTCSPAPPTTDRWRPPSSGS